MSDEHYGACVWTPQSEYAAHTPYGEIKMFSDNGQRAVEVMLLSAAACLNYFLVQYAQARKLPVERLEVRCDGDIAQRPDRVSHIRTHVAIEGGLSDKDAQRMVQICERACKVMNTLRMPPEYTVEIDNRSSAQAGGQSGSSGQG